MPPRGPKDYLDLARSRDVAVDKDMCSAVGVWPVRLVVGGVAGWSLWCSGDTDLLLARDGRVQVFGNADDMVAAVRAPDAILSPANLGALDSDVLESIAAVSPATFDLDGAAHWFSRTDRPVTVEDCDKALNAINMATNIGATAGDDRHAALVESEALLPVFDALTYGLTLLGDRSPYRNNPGAMVSVITPEAADAVARLVVLAAGHVEAR